MNRMRNVFLVLMAIVLAALALPSVAGNDKKQFILVTNVPPNQTSAPFTVTATVTNEGNSTINSFQLFVFGLTIVGVDPPATGKASGPFPGSSVSVKNMSPLKSGQSLVLTVSVNSSGDGQWGGVAWTGSQLNGQTFNLDTFNSTLTSSVPIGPPVGAGGAVNVPDSIATDCVVSGNRGAYDKDGSTPVPPLGLSVFVTNTVPANGQVHFRWPVDNSGDPAAAFEYTIACPGPLPPTTYLAWFNTDGTLSTGTTGTPDFISADDEDNPLDCLPPPPHGEVVPTEAILPAPYGTLIDGVQTTDSFIRVNTTGGAVTPGDSQFDIVVGTGAQTERMTVTLITCEDNEDFIDDGGVPDSVECGEEGEAGAKDVWVVNRAQGGTTAQMHSANAPVMYTPLPIMQKTQGQAIPPEYKAGNQAQMCVVKQSGDSESHSTTFIDIGDGHVGGP